MRADRLKKGIALFLCAALCCALSACVTIRPVFDPALTLAVSTPTLVPTATPKSTPVATPSPSPTADFINEDSLGNTVEGTEHYRQYLQLVNVQVYESCGDTFVDARVDSTYPETLICAIKLVFYRDGQEIASTNLQTRDGQYILSVTEGGNTVYGQVDTDISLTSLPYEVVFDENVGISPK